MVIRSASAGVLIDLAVNAPPDLPLSVTSAGPTLAPEELAGHKLLALFDRAAAPDFADVYFLARNTYGQWLDWSRMSRASPAARAPCGHGGPAGKIPPTQIWDTTALRSRG